MAELPDIASTVARTKEYYDGPAVRAITSGAAANDYRWSSLIVGIVESTPFQMRRPPSGDSPATVAAR